jgi:2-polyprenyl-6-methoxyphenol hydroxylase-like FAD-dependent oxidoreductase
MEDPWLRAFRAAPRERLAALMPGLAKITGPFEIPGAVRVRPSDLYVTTGVEQAGVVLVGDAFSTSCPNAGTGAGKALTDVERLCNMHIPQWLATPGMGAEKIAAFYADPVRAAYHAHAIGKAFKLRSLTLDPGPTWAAQRWLRFLARFAIGWAREFQCMVAKDHEPVASGSEIAGTLRVRRASKFTDLATPAK